MEATLIAEALKSLGVVRAAKQDDPLRWSVEDLATDLAAALKIHGEGPQREELAEGREHLTVTHTFQSDKYPWCPAGFLPLKISDPLATDLLYLYAGRRWHIDEEFARDLRQALPAPQGEVRGNLLDNFESLLETYRSEYPERTIRAIRSLIRDRIAAAVPQTDDDGVDGEALAVAFADTWEIMVEDRNPSGQDQEFAHRIVAGYLKYIFEEAAPVSPDPPFPLCEKCGGEQVMRVLPAPEGVLWWWCKSCKHEWGVGQPEPKNVGTDHVMIKHDEFDDVEHTGLYTLSKKARAEMTRLTCDRGYVFTHNPGGGVFYLPQHAGETTDIQITCCNDLEDLQTVRDALQQDKD